MGNMLFLNDNLADSGSVVTSSQATATPVTNLLSEIRNKIWVANTGLPISYPVTIDVTLPAVMDRAIAAVALYGHSLTAFHNSITFTAWSDAINGASQVATGTIPILATNHDYRISGAYAEGGYGGPTEAIAKSVNAQLSYALLPSFINATDARYWRISIDHISVTGTPPTPSASRIYIGGAWQPSVNFDWGSQLEFINLTKTRKNVYGQEFSNPVPDQRAFNFNLSWLPPEERDTLILQRLWQGGNTPMFVVPHSNAAQPVEETLYGLYCRSKRLGIGSRFANTHVGAIRFEEVM